MEKLYIEGPDGKLEAIEELDKAIKEQIKENDKHRRKRRNGNVRSIKGEARDVAPDDAERRG